MRSVEKRGRTVEEAIILALEELGTDREKVTVEVLEEGAKGLFGLLGSKEARVRVTEKAQKVEFVRKFLEEIGEALKVKVFVKVSESEDHVFAEVVGAEAGMLIGRHGQALDSLQYLVNLAASKASDDGRRVIVDVEGYRKRREEAVKKLAARMADRVRRTGKPVALEPMSSHERRIVHLALQDDPNVETHSEGEEPYRKIIISSKR
ncbi:MAG: protein jag [Firmicutes bacterium]|nr:protein jag [Bacillota bacterium]